MQEIRQGMKDGIPIALGYLSVSFTFGLMAVSVGMKWWQAALISMLNLTSAGQFAGLEIMVTGGTLVEMALSELVINIRYALMSLSLSQKTDQSFHTVHRWAVGAGITDEIFAVAMNRKTDISRHYMYGLIMLPYFGWLAGTLAGALLGDVLPEMISSSMGIAIYGMFIAIIFPKAREDKKIFMVILIAVILSCGFRWLPAVNRLSSGFVIIICAVAAAVIGAFWDLVCEKKESERIN